MDMKAPSLGSLIDKLSDLREKRRELAKKDDELKKQYDEIEQSLLQRLEAEGMDKATGKKATVSRSTSVVANVTNWESFHEFVKKTGFFHLLQRRISEPSYREVMTLAETDKKMKKLLDAAGVEPFTKVSLNLRNL